RRRGAAAVCTSCRGRRAQRRSTTGPCGGRGGSCEVFPACGGDRFAHPRGRRAAKAGAAYDRTLDIENTIDAISNRRLDGLKLGDRQFGERAAARRGPSDDLASAVVAAAEWQIERPHEPVGEIGRGAESG